MTPEAIATLIAAFGAIIAALFGIYRASSGNGASKPSSDRGGDIPNLVSRHLDLLTEIGRDIMAAVDVLRDIRKALEGTGHRQERMVEELETITRAIQRIENAQGAAAQVIRENKHQEEIKVQILSQIREEVKNLRDDRDRPTWRR